MSVSPSWKRPGGGGRAVARRLWRPPQWSLVQICSHLAVFYAIAAFAFVIQPAWLAIGNSRSSVVIGTFWLVFVLSLGLYGFVCFADTRYREGTEDTASVLWDSEPRICDDCSASITHKRAKHCQVCNKCIGGFDHHCRYLNVCVGSRTYTPWYCFVVSLFALMAFCSYSAVHALTTPESYHLASVSLVAFYGVAGLQVCISSLLSLFLFSLSAQHLFFIREGITTLEYIKDQAAGFPGVPPPSWREHVSRGECYSCIEAMEVVEVHDPNQVWFCNVCQVDLSRAGVEFYTCPSCENVSVCPVCRSVARDRRRAIVTYRTSALRRVADAQVYKDVLGSSCTSRLSSVSGTIRAPRLSRRTFSAAVAAVEGHTGENVRRNSFCTLGASDPRDVEEVADDEYESGSSTGEA